jgi:hypothetical protein
VPAHLAWSLGKPERRPDDRGGSVLVLPEERDGTTDLSKLNRSEAVRARPGRTETGTSVVDVEF